MRHSADVVVVGGGIIGLCCAYYLRLSGASVTVMDKGGMGSGASHVNAGLLVPSHIEPMAAPGVISQGIKWLSNPESPFYIKPRFDMDLTNWLWGFQKACTRENVVRSIPVLRDLALASLDLYDDMSGLPCFGDAGPQKTGLLMLHNSKESETHNYELADAASRAGLEAVRLNHTETLDLEPGIKTPFSGAVYYQQDASLDPGFFMERLDEQVRAMGVSVVPDAEVTGFRLAGNTVTHVRTNSGDVQATHVVLAAGSWSAHLAEQLGTRILLQPATGYSITIDDPAQTLKIPTILTDEKITVGPMRGKIRFAGTLTLVGFDAKVDPVRLRPIERAARLYFPEIDNPGNAMPEAQSGLRPCSSDGLPIIGPLNDQKNIFLATGHGMLGFTQGPITGKTIADMIAGNSTPFNLTELSPDRFS